MNFRAFEPFTRSFSNVVHTQKKGSRHLLVLQITHNKLAQIYVLRTTSYILWPCLVQQQKIDPSVHSNSSQYT